MTVFNRFLFLLGLFISFNLNAFCQEDDDDANDKIVEQLRQKYGEVEYFSNVFFVKQNGVWEFVDENGNLLTNIHMENVETNDFYADLTIKGKKYSVFSPYDDGRVLVERYGLFAYMDRNGNLTPFIYDEEGENANLTPTVATAIINTCDQIMQVSQEVGRGKYSSVKALEKSIDLELAGKLSSEVSDSLLVLLCKTYDNSPKDIDMKTAEDLFDATIAPCGQAGCEAVLAYYKSNGLDQKRRLGYVRQLADDYGQYHANEMMGDFLVEGALCPKDIQGAIDYYKKVIDADSQDFGESSRKKLADLWNKYGTQYDNLLGKLCAENESVEYFNDDYIILTNDGQTMLVDRDYHEVLPRGDYEIISNYEDNFVIGDESSRYQLVRKGGKPVLKGKYEEIKMVNTDEDYQVIAKRNGKWGVYDKEGNPITSMIFDDYTGSDFGNPKLAINGEEYTIFSLFNDGMMIVDKDDKQGCINTEGKVVLPFVYDGMAFTPKGNFFVLKDGKIGVVDRDGRELLPCKYDDIDYDSEERKYKLKTVEFFDL